jgi:hypothetical protein
MRTRAPRETSPRYKSPFNNIHFEQSTSAHGVDALSSTNEHRTTEDIQIAVSALEFRISEQIYASNTALLAHI